MSLFQNAFFRKVVGQGLCLLMFVVSFVGSVAKADSYYDYKNGQKYLCTSEQDSCEPTISKGACSRGTRTVTVIACNGSTKSFQEDCVHEYIYTCSACDWAHSNGYKYYYDRLADGRDTNGGTIDGFEDKAECLAARDADRWCNGNP